MNATWISLIVGATSLLIAALAFRFSYRFALKRKRLVCEIFPIVPLVSVREPARGLETVLYNEKPVTDVKTLIINFVIRATNLLKKVIFQGHLGLP